MVKSSGRILGPYSYAELGTLLGEKRLSYLDEVKEPNDRWRFIREHTKLKELVNRARESEMQNEDTGTNTVSESTITDFDIQIEKSSPEMHQGKEPIKEIKSAKEKSKRKKSLAFTFTAVLLALTVLLFLYQFQSKKEAARIYSLKLKADNSFLLGEYKDSLNYYKQIHNANALTESENLRLILLETVIDKQTVESRRLISALQESSEIKKIEAISYAVDKDYVKAEFLTEKILESDPMDLTAKINLIVLYLLKGEASKAEDKLLELENLLVSHPITYSLKALTALGLSEDPDGAEKLKNFVINNWEKFLSNTEYYVENLFLMSLIEAKIGHEDESKKWLDLLFKEISIISSSFKKDLWLIDSLLDWPHLDPYCNWLADKTKQALDKARLKTLCLMKTSDFNRAEITVNEALAQFPDDAILLQMKADLLIQLSRKEEALSAIRMIVNPTPATKYFETFFCENDDCRMIKTQESLQLDKNYLFSMATEIEILIKQSKHLLAQEKLLAGLKQAPNFKPFLKLQEELK